MDHGCATMTQTPNSLDLEEFFAQRHSGRHVLRRRPSEARQCGELLVESEVLTRQQLLRALQMQDRTPSLRLGQCIVALGYAKPSQVRQAVALHRALRELEAESVDSDQCFSPSPVPSLPPPPAPLPSPPA
jgi:hypothetical protein